ncbi:hypothetical protein IP70_13100 [alpha proteobacterium AAP38]|nr:hypothetical protein IP70_13100 [alpha proteobacterium AAP38]
MSIEDRVRRILSAVLESDYPPGTPVTREAEPKWDSLKHVEVIFAVEDEFGIQLDEDRMARIQSLDDIVKAVEAGDAP